ncbi:ATP-binding protein [Bacteroides thetaiotaomicron]|jgi:predicted AAA+ superfamily ATPase|uniref:ATP-binding protein n=1 Tax=Bacteroides thetaiotaomicron TaxID=818 RepID=UPI0039C1D3D2
MLNKYRQRIADRLLKRKLAGKGAVLLEGAKWCGKTTTAEQIAQSVLYMSESGKTEQNIQLATMNPRLLLRGDKPRLIDEWQVAPQLWDSIRFEADHSSGLGLFILTGSCVPADLSSVIHSGTGRFGWLRMRPMSLWESGDSTGEVSLKDIFDGKEQIEGLSGLDLERVAFVSCRGGWPLAVDMDDEIALDQAFDYLNAVEQRDIQQADGVDRDPLRVHRLLRSYARHQGAQANYSTIRADLVANEGDSLDEDTIASYIKALKSIFVVEDVEAWNPNLRSKTAIRTSDTRYFTDPSIAAAALGLGPADLISDLNTFGLIFETLCMRDLHVFAEALNGNVYHYRDKNGLECDAVIHLRDGRYGLIEIKLGGDKLISEGVQTLTSLAEKIDTSKMKKPSFLMVLTANGPYAYRREDGVCVVPIGCLRD